jgi:hypothetical protein
VARGLKLRHDHGSPRQPLLHQLGVMVARIVEKDMDEHHQRMMSSSLDLA